MFSGCVSVSACVRPGVLLEKFVSTKPMDGISPNFSCWYSCNYRWTYWILKVVCSMSRSLQGHMWKTSLPSISWTAWRIVTKSYTNTLYHGWMNCLPFEGCAVRSRSLQGQIFERVSVAGRGIHTDVWASKYRPVWFVAALAAALSIGWCYWSCLRRCPRKLVALLILNSN